MRRNSQKPPPCGLSDCENVLTEMGKLDGARNFREVSLERSELEVAGGNE